MGKSTAIEDNSHQEAKQRRLVLSEEEYTNTLSAIVQREYFPDLVHLERQAAVLERRSQGDAVGAVVVRRAVRRLAEHDELFAAQESQDEHDVDSANTRQRARPLHQESITGFHARATNEDDVEFDSKQKKEVKENRERLEKLFRPQEESERVTMITHMASDQYTAESNRIAATEWNQPKVRNGLFFNPTPIRNGPEQQQESTQLLTDGDDTTRINSSASKLALMPPPAKVTKKDAESTPVPKHALVEYIPKHALEKKIEPSQTRFPNKIVPMPSNSLVPGTASDVYSEIDGSCTDASTDLDAPLRPLGQERHSRDRKRERTQRSYVNMTPLIIPGTGNQSPIMTWGTVDSTPMVLTGQEEPPNEKQLSFSVPTENERDRAARKAEEEVARRTKRAKSSKTKKLGSLTPAAMSLLEKNRRTPSRTRDAFASSLRGSYTPKVRSSSSSNRRSSDNAYNATPLATQRQKSIR